MTAEEILQVLDEQFEVIHHDPPHLYQLWTHFYPADTRLTAFRSPDHWALVFEIVGYWRQSQTVRNGIWIYGSGLAGQSAHYEAIPLHLLDERTGEPLNGGPLDPQRFTILWNEQRYAFAPSDADYAEAGIVFDAERPDPDAHAAAQVVRYLRERLDHPFFLPPEEVRELLAQNWQSGEAPGDALLLFLQTRAWRHPDLSQEELPSRTSSFQILARALESGDLSAWDRQEPDTFNTDWRVYDWQEEIDEEQRREREARHNASWATLPAAARDELRQAGLGAEDSNPVDVSEAPPTA